MKSAGKTFREEIAKQSPLQILGVIDAYSAIQAQRVGAKALYLSGAGVANASYGLPDIGMTGLEDVCIDIRRIATRCELPLLVDADTGFGGAFNIARTIKEMTKAGAAGCHIEDQVAQKRCGHRPNKALVTTEEMCNRLKAAVDAKIDSDFVVMARTDSHASEGQNAALDRASAYVEAGADMIFAEAIHSLKEYEEFVNEIKVPVLANLTEFGATPFFTVDELASVGISMILYPLSGFRAMSKAALDVFKAIIDKETQSSVIDIMQTREELYDMLGYHTYEEKLDQLFSKDKG